MDAQTIILGFLMHAAKTGYELKKAFSLSFAFFSGLSYGSIYPALKKMEEQGLITMRLEIQDGAPNRKVYTITDRGREVFLRALVSPPALERYRSDFLNRLFFFAYLPPEQRISIASFYLRSLKEVQKLLDSYRSEIESHADRFQLLCYEFGVRFYRDLHRNIAQVVRDLENDLPDAASCGTSPKTP